jgi:integrase
MLDELQRRNYSQNTVSTYLHAVEDFSRYFHRSPDRLGPDHIRQYQAYLFRERKLQAGTIALCAAALRFLYVKTLRRPYLPEHIPFPKLPRQLPVVLSPEEVQRVIDSAENLMRRPMVMTLYSTGIRCSELCHLKVSDIDSERTVIHVHKGKGGRDRDVLLSPKLLETLREYWRWMKPRTYLFPGTVNNWRADVPITPKVVWKAVNEAGIDRDHRGARRPSTTSPDERGKRVRSHGMRPTTAFTTHIYSCAKSPRGRLAPAAGSDLLTTEKFVFPVVSRPIPPPGRHYPEQENTPTSNRRYPSPP